MIQTQTVDIGYVKKILACSPHYYTIIKYEYPYGDILSKKLIDWYRDLIFSANKDSKDQLALVQVLDQCLYLYVRDNKYKHGFRKIITADELNFENRNVIKEVIKKIIIYTDNYQKREVRELDVSKWL